MRSTLLKRGRRTGTLYKCCGLTDSKDKSYLKTGEYKTGVELLLGYCGWKIQYTLLGNDCVSAAE
jgi:hypothetical protein